MELEEQLKTLPLETLSKLIFADETYLQNLTMSFVRIDPTDTPENGGPIVSDATKMIIAFPRLMSGVNFLASGKYLPIILFYNWYYSDSIAYGKTICDIRIENPNNYTIRSRTAFRLLKQIYNNEGNYIEKAPVLAIAPNPIQVATGDRFTVRGFIETDQSTSSDIIGYKVKYLVGLLPVD